MLQDVALQLKTPLKLFDLGCGSTKKSQYLINELLANKVDVEYAPIDVSKGGTCLIDNRALINKLMKTKHVPIYICLT